VLLSIGVNAANFIKFNSLPSFLQLTVEVSQDTTMFDEYGDNEQPFDFDELANLLLEQGLEISPAQLHGALCGLLAAGASPNVEAGLASVTQALDVDLFGELAAQTMDLYRVSAKALQDDEFDFYPLLPDDAADIELRTESLGAWCRGFLGGYAQASTAVAGGDTAEVLSDMSDISEAGLDDEADPEETEGSYAELVEYVRFAVLNIAMDNRAA